MPLAGIDNADVCSITLRQVFRIYVASLPRYFGNATSAWNNTCALYCVRYGADELVVAPAWEIERPSMR